MKRYSLFLALLAVATLGGTVYKWVDESGVTHYSETLPPGRKVQEIEAPPPPPEETTKESQETLRRALQEQQQREELRKKEKEEQREQKAAQRREDAEKPQRCFWAELYLSRLETQGRVYKVDKLETRGLVYQFNERCERVYLDDSERPAEIERFRREVETHCEKGRDIVLDRKQLTASLQDLAEEQFCRCAPYRLQEMERPEARTPTSELEGFKGKIAADCGKPRK